MKKSFRVSTDFTIKLEVGCNIAILPAPNSKVVEIEVEAEEEEYFSIKQHNELISIVETKSISLNDNNINITGGNNVFIGNVFNSAVKFNDDDININLGNVQETYKQFKQPLIKIFVSFCNLEAQLFNNAMLASKVALKQTYLFIQGHSQATFVSHSLNINTQGISKVKAISTGGELDVNTSGSSNFEIQGSYSKVSINVSGLGNIRTIGHCLGNYYANISGMGEIIHSGVVDGKIYKNCSGMGSILFL